MPSIEQSLAFPEPKDMVDQNVERGTDIVMFPIKKFFRLILKGNPNMMDWLFCPEKNIRIMTDEGKTLRDMRGMFIGRQVGERCLRYAKAEYKAMHDVTGKTGAKRKAELEKYGYSPKMAMSSIRILQEGNELMEFGRITLPRPNAELLLEIKTGQVSVKEIGWIYEKASEWLKKLLEEKTAFAGSEPDMEAAEKLMVNLIVGDEIAEKMWGAAVKNASIRTINKVGCGPDYCISGTPGHEKCVTMAINHTELELSNPEEIFGKPEKPLDAQGPDITAEKGKIDIGPPIPDPKDATKPPDVNLRSILKKGSQAKA